MRECPTCNHRNNPDHATTCVACRLELPRSNPYTPLPKPNQKMVVFDLDKTLYDLTRRERIAKREGHKPGSNAWYSSMNKPQHIPKDTVIPGTLDFARKLENDGYVIAYLTGRPDHLKSATRQKLKEDGFPIHRFSEELLFLSPTVNSNLGTLANYKKAILTRLSNEFDVAFFFDDSREFREAAKTVQPRIPGIYPSIADYTGEETSPKKARSNPTSELVMVNPVPKPRKKRNKAGNMVKESVKNYLQRFMGNPQMVEEFPDNAQRFAVGLSYAKKFYGEKTVNKHYPPIRTNPGVSVADAKKMYKQFHQKNPSKVEKKTMNIGETWIGLGKAWSIGYRSGKETGDENQKYIHNFGVDEETGKKFKEPDLFYVPGEGGSEDLLIVTGGDWYIDVDADGKVSWIYI